MLAVLLATSVRCDDGTARPSLLPTPLPTLGDVEVLRNLAQGSSSLSDALHRLHAKHRARPTETMAEVNPKVRRPPPRRPRRREHPPPRARNPPTRAAAPTNRLDV